MLDEALRKRLEVLNRGELPAEIVRNAPVHVAVRPLAEASSPKVAISSPVPERMESECGKPIPGILRLGEVVETSAGAHLRICVPIDRLWSNGSQLVAGRHEHLHQRLAESRQAVEPTVVMEAEFAALVAAMPERLMLLDLETCGLGGSALFLAGVLRHVQGVPTVELLMARNYSEEQAVLESLWQIVASQEVLVTFNGKAFDWPMVLDRSARYRMAPRVAGEATRLRHVDMLHHARRRWRRQLPDCRLQTLEQFVCRRRRSGDIAGSRIPAAYAEYVRTGFEREMEAVLYHNAMDLVTLLDLSLRLAG